MTKVANLSLIALFLVGLVVAGQTTQTGILIDAACGVRVQSDLDKALAHTTGCALMEPCVESGYGLIVDGQFLKFDEAGDKIALNYFQSTSRENNHRVRVTGDFSGEMVKVAEIKAVE